MTNTSTYHLKTRLGIMTAVSLFFFMQSITAFSQTRLGLFYTQEELNIWKDRSINGPYKSNNDVTSNSPGDWDRIVSKANLFKDSINAGKYRKVRYNGPYYIDPTVPGAFGKCTSCANNDPGEQGTYLRDAAFYFLLKGDASFLTPVKAELLNYANNPTFNFSNTTLWKPDYIGDINPGFGIAEFMTTLLMAYDFTKGNFSNSEKQVLNTWFSSAAEYFRSQVDPPFERIFVNFRTEDYTLTPYGRAVNLSDKSSIAYYGHPGIPNLAKYYNNRRSSIERFVGFVGVFLNNDTYKNSAYYFARDWLKFSTFPDGTLGEYERFDDTDKNADGTPRKPSPDKGWAYASSIIANISQIADVYARNGDFRIYNYSTSYGLYGTEGGNKTLKLVIDDWLKYVDGTHVRYGTDEAAKNGNDNYRINTYNPFDGWDAVCDIWAAHSNNFYKDQNFTSIYTRTKSNTRPYPVRPSTAGPYVTWMGLGGVLPGELFMFGKMEGQVCPYGNNAPTANAGADKSIDLPTNSITIMGSGSDDDGNIKTFLWTQQAGPAATLTNINTQSLTASSLVAGTYIFRLTATDNCGKTAFDDVQVKVNNPINNLKFEAESIYSILSDPGSNPIGVENHVALSNGSSAKIWDVGDKIRLTFSAIPGNYILKVRVRAQTHTSFYANGYSFWLNGTSALFRGDSSSISDFNASYGGSYWGDMTLPVIIAAGQSFIDVQANSSWLGVDYITLDPVKYEAESIYSPLADPGSNPIGVENHVDLSNGSSAKLWDIGDKIRLTFNSMAGNYILKAHIRAQTHTLFYTNGYSFWVNGSPTSFTGDVNSISAFNASYGGSYWGDMTASVTLNAGQNFLDVQSNSTWLGVDYIELVKNTSGTRVAFFESESIPGSISVFPNPVKDRMTINLSEKASGSCNIQIFDILGKLQYNKTHTIPVTHKIEVELSETPIKSGVYFLKIGMNKSEGNIIKILKE